jgi:hypothetical protein
MPCAGARNCRKCLVMAAAAESRNGFEQGQILQCAGLLAHFTLTRVLPGPLPTGAAG